MAVSSKLHEHIPLRKPISACGILMVPADAPSVTSWIEDSTSLGYWTQYCFLCDDNRSSAMPFVMRYFWQGLPMMTMPTETCRS